VNLLHFQKPGRYINNEYNALHKKARVSVALAFPDIYDVGMSHLGLKILYAVLNDLTFASAERVFAPWPDLEAGMRENREPLCCLESGRPLHVFDIVGFSLQYELSYTTVLNMLDLGGIPLTTERRMESQALPLIIAGGPCSVNPQPMSPFIDAFLIGDGEEAVVDMVSLYHLWKSDGARDKTELLKALTGIPGVFVPLFGNEKTVCRRYIDSLESAPFPTRPVVPYTNIVHDRINIEISRGCTMGCRFCQAGMIYRPVRERSPEKVMELAGSSLKSTGYDTATFTSLSSGDYSCLNHLMKAFNNRFYSERISLSLPSLRVGSVNEEMLRELRAVRKSGFTIAPEAATDRLRAVINKDFTAETYTRALDTLFRAGWQSLKLYFMIGLPTETDEDISAIPAMVFEAIKTSKRLTGRHATLSVGVSPYVPKPHTPFQWYGQNSLEYIREKNSYIKSALLRRGVQFRGHDPEMSLLEAGFSRGDKSLAGLIEEAWKLGCRLDAWTEFFDFGKWRQAMENSGVDAAAYAGRQYSEDSSLPWDNIDIGITRKFLWKEYQNAVSARITPDCRKGCHACGLKCRPEDLEHGPGGQSGEASSSSATPGRTPLPARASIRVRIQYEKSGILRYLSHLETTSALIRGMRRAGFPFKYTEGFHPAPKVSFGPALGVGIAGIREYLDIELMLPFDIQKGLVSLQQSLPDGLKVRAMKAIDKREKSLGGFIVRYTYEIIDRHGLSTEGFSTNRDTVVQRKANSFRLSEMVEELENTGDVSALLTVRDLGEIKVRLDELLPLLFGRPAEDLEITRLAMHGWENEWKEPLEDTKTWAARS
jgi:radical SAM family uncharacterized protein/radical SAM-linked protein